MGTESLRLELGGLTPSVSDGVLWLLWVLSQIFLLIMLEQYSKEFMHNGHKSHYTSHLRGKKNGLCQVSTYRNTLNNSSLQSRSFGFKCKFGGIMKNKISALAMH